MQALKFLTTCWLAVACLAMAAEARVWTDSTGRYTLDANLVAYNENTVVLQRADHEMVAVPVEKLSDQDREYLKSNEAGELVTHLGEHPSLKIGDLLETHKHGINDILIESLAAENAGLTLYRQLLDLVRDRSVLLEDYARRMIAEEELHVGEVNKMLRKPGEITQFEA